MGFAWGVWADLQACTWVSCCFQKPFASAGAAGAGDWTPPIPTPPAQVSPEMRNRRSKRRPTFVLDFKKPLLPEAPERGDASAGADEDAGHLGILGQVEPRRTAHIKDAS